MSNIKIFINIKIYSKNLSFIIIRDSEFQPIFQKKINIENVLVNSFLITQEFENILKKNILEIEKKIGISVNNINLMIEGEKTNSVDIALKKNFENKNIDKTLIEYLLQDIRKQIIKNHPDKKIAHIIISKCFMDGEEYNNIPLGKRCKSLMIEINFIYFKKSFISSMELILKNHQIDLNRIICTNYAKSLLSSDLEDLPRAGLAALSDRNLNEISTYSKKSTKLGFFEKLFHIFS